MATASAGTKLTMKLHIDTTARRVVFAETTKAVVDYLVSLLEEHASLLGLEEMLWKGCVDNLFDSAEELADAAANANEHGTCCSFSLPPSVQRQQAKTRFFKCSYKRGPACDKFVTETSGAVRPSCGWQMATEVPYGTPGAGCSGTAADSSAGTRSAAPVACVLTDDLRATATSGSRLATLTMMRTPFLANFCAALEEKTVQLGHNECLAIVEATLRSRAVLTDVFLGKKGPKSSHSPSHA